MKININKIKFDYSKFTLPKVMIEKTTKEEKKEIKPVTVWIPTIYDLGRVEVNSNMKEVRYNNRIIKGVYRKKLDCYVCMVRIYGMVTFIHLTNDIIKRD